jgi:hypothetical protein
MTKQKTEEKAKIRIRINQSPRYDTYKEASDFKDFVLNSPELMATGVDVIKIKRRPKKFPQGQRYRRHNRVEDTFQVICYSKPE